jgi:hypothetical protein
MELGYILRTSVSKGRGEWKQHAVLQMPRQLFPRGHNNWFFLLGIRIEGRFFSTNFGECWKCPLIGHFLKYWCVLLIYMIHGNLVNTNKMAEHFIIGTFTKGRSEIGFTVRTVASYGQKYSNKLTLSSILVDRWLQKTSWRFSQEAVIGHGETQPIGTMALLQYHNNLVEGMPPKSRIADTVGFFVWCFFLCFLLVIRVCFRIWESKGDASVIFKRPALERVAWLVVKMSHQLMFTAVVTGACKVFQDTRFYGVETVRRKGAVAIQILNLLAFFVTHIEGQLDMGVPV